MLNRRVHQEWVIFVAETDISGKVALKKSHTGVGLHLQEVVFILPHERDVLELLQTVLVVAHFSGASRRGAACVGVVCQQEVVDQLLSPLDDALYNVERQHPERVQDVQALVEELVVALTSVWRLWNS